MGDIKGMGEDRLVETLLREVPVGEGAAGPGDDCAVIDHGDFQQLLKTDAMVEGLHWNSQTDARRVGHKAIARVSSDIAAMGGTPAQFMVTLAIPPSTRLEWARELYRGMGDCLRKHGGIMVGGETTGIREGSPIMISVAASGEVGVGRAVLRSTGQAGDMLLVTGTLGGSLAGKHLDFSPRIQEAAWLTRNFMPSAMMDLSDGLAKDLPRLAKASACGFKLEREAIPCSADCTLDQALKDGEDYELLLSIDAQHVDRLLVAWSEQFELALTVIGELCELGSGDELEGGWDHFGIDS